MHTQRTITIQIADDPDLLDTLFAYWSVQQALSPICFHEGNPLCATRLQEICYHQIKGRLLAQMACSAIRNVAGAYKSAKSNSKQDQTTHKNRIRAAWNKLRNR